MRFLPLVVVAVLLIPKQPVFAEEQLKLEQVLSEAEALCALVAKDETTALPIFASGFLTSAYGALGEIESALALSARMGFGPTESALSVRTTLAQYRGTLLPLPKNIAPEELSQHLLNCAERLALGGDFQNARLQLAQLPSERQATYAYLGYRIIAQQQVASGDDSNSRDVLRSLYEAWENLEDRKPDGTLQGLLEIAELNAQCRNKNTAKQILARFRSIIDKSPRELGEYEGYWLWALYARVQILCGAKEQSFQNAIETIESYAKSHPEQREYRNHKLAMVYTTQGNTYVEIGELERAMAAYQIAWRHVQRAAEPKLDPWHSKRIAIGKYRAGSLEQAFKICDQLDIANRSSLLRKLADQAMEQNRREDAQLIAARHQALLPLAKDDRQRVVTLVLGAEVYSRTNLQTEADRNYAAALQISNLKPGKTFHNSIASSQTYLGRYADAYRVIREMPTGTQKATRLACLANQMAIAQAAKDRQANRK